MPRTEKKNVECSSSSGRRIDGGVKEPKRREKICLLKTYLDRIPVFVYICILLRLSPNEHKALVFGFVHTYARRMRGTKRANELFRYKQHKCITGAKPCRKTIEKYGSD